MTTFKYQDQKCDVEVFSNADGIVVKFFDKRREPAEDGIRDYVYVEPGYGYIHLKRKREEGILSGFLKKDFFVSSAVIDAAIDFVVELLPGMQAAYVPYRLERIVVYDAATYTGETFEDLKAE